MLEPIRTYVPDFILFLVNFINLGKQGGFIGLDVGWFRMRMVWVLLTRFDMHINRFI